jgi:hypothetical protein
MFSCASGFFIIVVIVQPGRKGKRLLVPELSVLYFYAKDVVQLY